MPIVLDVDAIAPALEIRADRSSTFQGMRELAEGRLHWLWVQDAARDFSWFRVPKPDADQVAGLLDSGGSDAGRDVDDA